MGLNQEVQHYINNIQINNADSTFDVPLGYIDLDKTMDCGQCFRWNKVKPDEGYDKAWLGIVTGRLIIIESKDNQFTGKTSIKVNINNKAQLGELFKYLGLTDDYIPLHGAILTEYERSMVDKGLGIRILNQDEWEVIVSFIISQRNSIPKIKSTIEKMCKAFGTRRSCGSLEYYTFPTPKQIIKAGIDGLTSCSLGYRAEYVYLAAVEWINNPNKFKQLSNPNMTGEAVIDSLMDMKGIGLKVGSCIALFGYHKLNIFPIDVWIQRVLDEHYPNGIALRRFNGLAGLMQQYMFYGSKY